ncbi:MAG: ATP-binding protein [Desulfuromonadaceae bacterium]|nr:ATP-binding protein [Desulfuromonadaceae bacterium]
MSPHALLSRFRSNFQLKLFGAFTLLTALITIIFCTLYIITEIREKREHATIQIRLLTQYLADSVRLPLYAENTEVLKQLAEEAAHRAEIRRVVIATTDGRVVTDIQNPSTDTATTILNESAEVRSIPFGNSPSDMISSEKHNIPGSLIGTVRIERGTGDLTRMIRTLVVVSTGIALVFWLSVSLLSYMVLRQVTRSFNVLVHGIDTMKDGDFNSRISIESDDEAGQAARAVNNLARTLQQRGEENSSLQEERLNLERQILQTQKLESLGVMAGGIAHDFNNLLQSMCGNMELASLKLDAASTAQKYISNAMTSAKHAALLTNLMLTYVGKGVITKKEIYLNSLIRENVEIVNSATSRVISFDLHLSPELPFILADEAHIQQIVMNLITNAVESIQEQPGSITITTGTQNCDHVCLAASLLNDKPEPGRYAFLEISDNGCGMNEETLKRLFDPFFTTKFTGRGLGMSAVNGIMRTHRGALFVESKPGTGTTFRVLFPIPESAPPAAIQAPVASPAKTEISRQHELSGMALVVDDEKSVLKVCTTMVKHCGYTVITACDGVDAIAKFREHADEIVVVLMDLIMPNMDGIAAMKEIYRIRPDIKVIISSGFNEEELSDRITNHAPSGFIRKPYSLNVLETELRRVMQAA